MIIVITYDGPDANPRNASSTIIHQHRLKVLHSVQEALESMGHNAVPLPADASLQVHLNKVSPQLVFNLAACPMSAKDRANAPLLLEEMGIPFTGSPVGVCAIAMDKARAKARFLECGIPTPIGILVRNADEIHIPENLAFPLFAKPSRGGCSRGIGLENLIQEPSGYASALQRIIRQCGGPVLVEEFLPGREFSAGILGNEAPQVLPIKEFLFEEGGGEVPFRSFRRKMVCPETEPYQCPANVAPHEEQAISELALAAYCCLGCRDYARVDIRMGQDSRPCVLEVNALPSLVRGTSSFSLMAEKARISYEKMIGKILSLACRRYHISCDAVANIT